jgi:prolyl-tRNA synthetase
MPRAKTAKAVFITATFLEAGKEVEKLVFAIVRGDMDLNEIKLVNAIKAKAMRPATEDEIRAVGAVPGFASPVGIDRTKILIVVDDLIPQSPNLVAGANEIDYHYKNVNYGRDYEAHIVADIVSAREGDPTINGNGILQEVRGVEVGNIFKLGTDFTIPLGATYLDENGERKPVIMGSYGIGVGRLLACVAEEFHDEHGLMLPMTVAPYQVHLVMLPGDGLEAIGDAIYAELVCAGIEVLYDDRDERAGVKFNDADLIGLPLRLTVSKRSLESGGVEFKRRDRQDRAIIARDDVLKTMQAEIQNLFDDIRAKVVEVPYQG